MKILVIGSGGREHAIAWKLAGEGTSDLGRSGQSGHRASGTGSSVHEYLDIARDFEVDLTIVGPEAPLADGIVDRFRAAGRKIVGANQENAKLEASKIHSKQFMERVGIPTARFVQTEDEATAIKALNEFEYPIVVKADGLAAGKGVIIAQDRAEAEAAVRSLGPRLVIEEFLDGEEVSFIVLSDGKEVVALEASQDHKRVGDNDTGPNTGGMGAYCDGRIFTPEQSAHAMDFVIRPAVEATGFTGFLYAGLMMTKSGPKVLEFNVRLGDPETQPLMHRMRSNWGEVLLASATPGGLAGVTLDWASEPSVCVVMAAHGYPGTVRTGDAIRGIEDSGAEVFQAGTKIGQKGLETSGGRVLGVTAAGEDLTAAIANAYAAVDKIHFDGAHWRRDIGAKGLKRWD
ncbi:MAG: phosphoribosylamine--glycine ligase [Acidobacteriota bacterium]